MTSTPTITTLVDEHADALHRFFRSSGVPYADAQDLVQQTFEVMLGKDLAAIEAPKQFLWGVARKKLLQFRTRQRPSEEFNSSDIVQAITSPSQRLDRRLRVQMLLQRLGDEERTAFLMRCEGLTIDEISAAMDLGAATIKRRLAEARGHIDAINREAEASRQDEPLSVDDIEDSYRHD